MEAPGTSQAGSIGVRWYLVALVTAAIAISYFDRQTLPVAISAIERTIPLNDQQFSWLQFAFLIPYALLYAGGGRLLDFVGHATRIHPDHAVVVGGLRSAWAGHELRGFARGTLPAGDGRRGSVSGSDPSGGGVGSARPAIDRDGDHQCGDGGWVGAGAAVDRLRAHDERLEDGVLRRGRRGAGLGAVVVCQLSGKQRRLRGHPGCSAGRAGVVVSQIL